MIVKSPRAVPTAKRGAESAPSTWLSPVCEVGSCAIGGNRLPGIAHPALDQPGVGRGVHRAVEFRAVEPARLDIMEEIAGGDRRPRHFELDDDVAGFGVELDADVRRRLRESRAGEPEQEDEEEMLEHG